VKKVCKTNNLEESHEWLLKFARTGQIPCNRPIPVEERSQLHSVRGWDFVEEIGVPGRPVNVPVLPRVPHIKYSAAFWDIPLDVIPFVAPLPTVVQDVTCPPVR
jgi:hypothetical protein